MVNNNDSVSEPSWSPSRSVQEAAYQEKQATR